MFGYQFLARTGNIKSIFKCKRNAQCVCFSPNSKSLADSSYKFVYLLNLKNGNFSPYSTTLASGIDDNSIRLRDILIQYLPQIWTNNIIEIKCFIDYLYSSYIKRAYILILGCSNFERRIQKSIWHRIEDIFSIKSQLHFREINWTKNTIKLIYHLLIFFFYNTSYLIIERNKNHILLLKTRIQSRNGEEPQNYQKNILEE
ncbi:unnamed protein product [Paramecium octaurelia]|uniref:Uncharacterized protein n=1 Tax=Paramecium octaurelia TaxID=43137 RepID=A0A8S1UT33_PAROT|nr:unnamed protein product [Paramecium octaurelia]